MSRDPLKRPKPSPGPPPEVEETYDLAEPTPGAPRTAPKASRAEPPAEEPSTFRPAPSRPRPESPRANRVPGPARTASSPPKGPLGPDADEEFAPQPKRTKSVVEGEQQARGLVERIKLGGVNSGDLAQYTRQLGVYLHSGVGTTKALESLANQYRGSPFGPLSGRLAEAVRRGDSLTDAASREPWAFDRLFLSMVRVAEARGGLPETLKHLSTHYEARQRMIRQARSALIYPTAVILITLAVGGLLTFFVLPKLVEVLEDLTKGRSASLPLPTRMLVGLSHFITAVGWWLIPLAAVGSFFGLVWAYRTPKGKAILDRVCLRIPVMGNLLAKIDTARFTRTLSDLLSAGLGFVDSLTLTADVLHLDPYRAATLAMRAEIKAGGELSTVMRDSGRFDPEVLAFVETGEETGDLPESLGRVASEYEERVEHMVKNLASLLQPLIIIILGSIVGFVAIAFVMAYISVIASLAGGM